MLTWKENHVTPWNCVPAKQLLLPPFPKKDASRIVKDVALVALVRCIVPVMVKELCLELILLRRLIQVDTLILWVPTAE